MSFQELSSITKYKNNEETNLLSRQKFTYELRKNKLESLRIDKKSNIKKRKINIHINQSYLQNKSINEYEDDDDENKDLSLEYYNKSYLNEDAKFILNNNLADKDIIFNKILYILQKCDYIEDSFKCAVEELIKHITIKDEENNKISSVQPYKFQYLDIILNIIFKFKDALNSNYDSKYLCLLYTCLNNLIYFVNIDYSIENSNINTQEECFSKIIYENLDIFLVQFENLYKNKEFGYVIVLLISSLLKLITKNQSIQYKILRLLFLIDNLYVKQYKIKGLSTNLIFHILNNISITYTNTEIKDMINSIMSFLIKHIKVLKINISKKSFLYLSYYNSVFILNRVIENLFNIETDDHFDIYILFKYITTYNLIEIIENNFRFAKLVGVHFSILCDLSNILIYIKNDLVLSPLLNNSNYLKAIKNFLSHDSNEKKIENLELKNYIKKFKKNNFTIENSIEVINVICIYFPILLKNLLLSNNGEYLCERKSKFVLSLIKDNIIIHILKKSNTCKNVLLRCLVIILEDFRYGFNYYMSLLDKNVLQYLSTIYISDLVSIKKNISFESSILYLKIIYLALTVSDNMNINKFNNPLFLDLVNLDFSNKLDYFMVMNNKEMFEISYKLKMTYFC